MTRKQLLVYPLILAAVGLISMTLNFAASAVHPETLRGRVVEMLSSDPREHVLRRHWSAFEICQTTSAALASAETAPASPLPVRLLLLRVHSASDTKPVAHSSNNYCTELHLAAGGPSGAHPAWFVYGATFPQGPGFYGYFKPRYAAQQVSVYALMLSMMSAQAFERVVAISTLFAAALLVWSFSLLGGRLFLATAPVCMGAGAWALALIWNGASNGITYFAAVLFLALTALAVRWRGESWGPPCCFAMGAGLQLFWFMDSHQILVLALVTLLGYFALNPERPWLRAALWAGAYLAGSGAVFVLGVLARAAVLSSVSDAAVVSTVTDLVQSRYDRYQSLNAARTWDDQVLPYDDFQRYTAVIAENPVEFILLTLLFIPITIAAGYLCLRRGWPSVRPEDLWPPLVMAFLSLVQLIAPEDLPFRAPRYLFVPAGLFIGILLLEAARLRDRLPLLRRRTPQRQGRNDDE